MAVLCVTIEDTAVFHTTTMIAPRGCSLICKQRHLKHLLCTHNLVFTASLCGSYYPCFHLEGVKTKAVRVGGKVRIQWKAVWSIVLYTSVPLGMAQLLKLVSWTDCGRLWNFHNTGRFWCANDQKGIEKQTHNEVKIIPAARTRLATLVLNTHVHFLPCVSSQHAALADAPQLWTIVCNELCWLYCSCKGFCSYRSIVV